jgi:hypothetical protein
MRVSSPAFLSGSLVREQRQPLTLTEALRTYFVILFGVAVSVLAFYYLFP